jgi:hypothetical protein
VQNIQNTHRTRGNGNIRGLRRSANHITKI